MWRNVTPAAKGATASSAKRDGRFRLENGLLLLTQPDGKREDAYIRTDATKEELKRAGVRYGDKPAELDPRFNSSHPAGELAPGHGGHGVEPVRAVVEALH